MLKKLLAILAMFYAVVSFAAVDINTATVADLDSIKGIGPAMSARILDERKKGQFKDWEDFVGRVKGIGSKNAAKFSAAGLTVNGVGYTGAPPSAGQTTPAGKQNKASARKEKASAPPASIAPSAAAPSAAAPVGVDSAAKVSKSAKP